MHAVKCFVFLMCRCTWDNNRLDVWRTWLEQGSVSASYTLQSPSSQDGGSSRWSAVCMWLLCCFQNAGLYWPCSIVCVYAL